MKIIVHLTPTELRHAAIAAVDVRIRAMLNGQKPPEAQRHIKNHPWWHHDIVGYVAELAACKALGYEWAGSTPTTNFKAPDCGPYQVRSIEDKSHGLLIRSRDADDDIYILGQVSEFRVCLHGWTRGRTARQLGEPRFEDAIRVDIHQLYGMEELPEWDDIEWDDHVQAYDPDERIRQYRASMIG